MPLEHTQELTRKPLPCVRLVLVRELRVPQTRPLGKEHNRKSVEPMPDRLLVGLLGENDEPLLTGIELCALIGLGVEIVNNSGSEVEIGRLKLLHAVFQSLFEALQPVRHICQGRGFRTGRATQTLGRFF